MATTTNFGWTTPNDTDLVKDGAAAIRTLGSSIDTSMAGLKGGTTGQVLSKTSGTDMAFTWVAQDDSNAIQNALVDAKGDLIAATANDTPARLAVGNNGETLVADSSTSTGLRYTANFAAAKNKIINGNFNVNQRSFSSQALSTEAVAYTFDRFFFQNVVGGTTTCSAQTFTAGAAPVAGYESTNFIRLASTGQSSGAAGSFIAQPIEDVRTLAGQTATVSFWAKASSGTPKVGFGLRQQFGTGGSTSVENSTSVTISTSWVRYSYTFTLGSMTGKTIGASSSLATELWTSAGVDFNSRAGSIGIQTTTIDFWGVQVEAGSVATAFQTATGTIQGELAACQRYYFRTSNDSSFSRFASGSCETTTAGVVQLFMPVQMRVAPTAVEWSNLRTTDLANDYGAPSSVTINTYLNTRNIAVFNVADTGWTAYRPLYLEANNNAAAHLAVTAEL